MGYHVEGHARGITKSGFIRPWQFLVTQLGICFLKKIVNFNEISYKLMKPVHAIVEEVPYNCSHYIMGDFVSNFWSSRPFLVYPRFLMRLITHRLDFGGVPVWYPRAEMLLKENFHNAHLVPTVNDTGLVTHLWVFAKLIFYID
ncbi:hypothetical protein Hanom_Chr07g00626641 [Helianthus anomalus]